MKRIDANYVPKDDKDLLLCLNDPVWRICSGGIYKIMIKDSDGDKKTIIPFVPNRAQRTLLFSLWYRNIILKARQLGFTTLVTILWLDHALFNANQRCGIIAQDKDASESIFRDKVKLAYDHLPVILRANMPLKKDSATELLFAHNNSSVKVATSVRSGTIHRLLVSEFGKICAKYPEKASEIVTGSLPAVPLNGISIIESTAEGRDGDFYKMTNRAKDMSDKKASLSERDYRFHFFPWWQEPGYRMESPGGSVITKEDDKYFEEVEAKTGATLDVQQRNWYVATRNSDFSGENEKMWQEYPSTPEEAFQQSTEGCYYAVQLTAARKAGRICHVPYNPSYPVNTFWDIGASDGTAIWLHQHVGIQHRFIGFIEEWSEPYDYFIRELQKLEYVWGTHYLPHDADHKRQQGQSIESPMDMLKKIGGIGGDWVTVDKVADITHGIQLVRSQFGDCWFDQVNCDKGIAHIGAYRKEWDSNGACWKKTPKHDQHSEAADAFRQFAQGYTEPVPIHPVLQEGGRRYVPPSRAGY